jgi:hypothetical protein
MSNAVTNTSDSCESELRCQIETQPSAEVGFRAIPLGQTQVPNDICPIYDVKSNESIDCGALFGQTITSDKKRLAYPSPSIPNLALGEINKRIPIHTINNNVSPNNRITGRSSPSVVVDNGSRMCKGKATLLISF